jgi:DNA-binding transcriptional LysR family regulator
LRLKLSIKSCYFTDSTEVAKYLIDAGLGYGVLPISAYCREIREGRLRYAPLCEPTLTQQLCVAASAQLELPRELAVKMGDIIREEAARLTRSGVWPAKFLAPHRWDPNLA